MDDYKEWAQNFSMDWFGELLNSIEHNCSQETCEQLFNQCGVCHYKLMEPMLEQYVGDLKCFLELMSKEHGQIITYDENTGKILVDENKDYCVCPVTLSMSGKKVSPVLCHCSASMTAKMIEKIIGKEVHSKVAKSVLRGDQSCVYEITL